jgi:hypothetical protein
VLERAGPDTAYLGPSLSAHQARFGRPPFLVAGDRGVFSAEKRRTWSGSPARWQGGPPERGPADALASRPTARAKPQARA